MGLGWDEELGFPLVGKVVTLVRRDERCCYTLHSTCFLFLDGDDVMNYLYVEKVPLREM